MDPVNHRLAYAVIIGLLIAVVALLVRLDLSQPAPVCEDREVMELLQHMDLRQKEMNNALRDVHQILTEDPIENEPKGC